MARGKKFVGTTRRKFLIRIGVALTSGVFSVLAGYASITAIFRKKNQISSRIEHDSSLCAGCGICTLMCSLYHEKETIVSLSRAELIREPFEGKYFMNICQQCPSSNCYQACPQKDSALCIDKQTGIKYINSAKCTGCGECIRACPQKPPGIRLNPDTNVAFKCDLCRGREKGPICVEYCSQYALSVV